MSLPCCQEPCADIYCRLAWDVRKGTPTGHKSDGRMRSWEGSSWFIAGRPHRHPQLSSSSSSAPCSLLPTTTINFLHVCAVSRRPSLVVRRPPAAAGAHSAAAVSATSASTSPAPPHYDTAPRRRLTECRATIVSARPADRRRRFGVSEGGRRELGTCRCSAR